MPPPFDERYPTIAHEADLAPQPMRLDIIAALAGMVEINPLRTIVYRSLNRRMDFEFGATSRERMENLYRACTDIGWKQFFVVVESVLAGMSGLDLMRAGAELDRLFRAYRMPWRIEAFQYIGGEVDADAWPALDESQVEPVSPTSAHNEPPTRIVGEHVRQPRPTNFAAIYAVLGTFSAVLGGVGGYTDISTYWKHLVWSGLGASLLALTGAAVWHYFDSTLPRLGRSAFAATVIAGTGLILIYALQPRPDPTIGVKMTSSETAVAPSATNPALSLQQLAAVTAFARASAPQTVLIISGGTFAARLAATSLANALEAGGWTVQGRRADGDRLVTFRLGDIAPEDSHIAVAPSTPIAKSLIKTMVAAGVKVGTWPTSEPASTPPIRIWFAQ